MSEPVDLEMKRIMMLISAKRSNVKSTAKIQNVVATEPAGMSEIAAPVGSTS